MENKISVVVPAYNIDNFIRDCIESIRSQSYINWELILVDDGSNDSTGLICDEYSIADERIRTIHQVNKGVSAARNVGISESRGEWIMFVDGDDYLLPGAFESYCTAISKWNPDIIIANTIRRNECGEEQLMHSMMNNEHIVYKGEKIIQSGLWSMLFRNDIIKNNNIVFDEALAYSEDSLFKYMVLNNISRIARISHPLYVYRWNSNSAVASPNYQRVAHFQFLASIKYQNFNKSINNKQSFKRSLEYATRWVLCLGMKAIARCNDKEIKKQIKKDFYSLYGRNMKSVCMINFWPKWYRLKFVLLSIRNTLFM